MIKYILKRLAIGAITLFALTTITFYLTRLMPGNPFQTENISTSMLETITAHYGLDKPIDQQYVIYLKNLLHGDMGISYKKSGVSVNDIIAAGFPVTMKLGVITYIAALFIGIALGIWMAVTKKEFVRGTLLTVSTLGVSIPNFVFAIFLMLVFGVILQWCPVLGLDTPKHYILPVITQVVYPVAQISRLVQSSYTEAMNQDYVIMARAKGLTKWTITIRHILKNAILPVITVSGPMLAFLITGSFVVENLFTIPGIGREFVNSISNRDYTVIMGLTIFIGAIIIVANLIVDIICALVDPRIKLND